VLIAGIGLVWSLLTGTAVLAPLAVHLDHDRATLATLDAARRHRRRGRPRRRLYAAALGALAFFFLWLWTSSR
jgi:hypothetical protein